MNDIEVLEKMYNHLVPHKFSFNHPFARQMRDLINRFSESEVLEQQILLECQHRIITDLKKKTDYAWKDLTDCEYYLGFAVNNSFRHGFKCARLLNSDIDG